MKAEGMEIGRPLPHPEAPTSVEELFQESEQRVYRRTDKLFFVLFGLQWIAGIIFALVVSPRAWAGSVSSVHLHVYAAIFLGAGCCLVPMFFCWYAPGAAFTRHIVAIGQTAYSALLIHLTGGRIETHFHVFGSLAFLACYRDWRVLITATVVVAADHFIRGIWYPMSVYGVLLAAPWRVAEHALWVVFEDVILIWSCRVSRQDMYAICEKEHQNRRILASLETIVRERTAELEAEVMERRRSEAATRASEERYRALVVNSPQIIMTLDRNYSIRFINRTVEGLVKERVLGSNFLAYHPESDQEQLRNALSDVFEYGQTRTLEVVGPGAGGSTGWYSVTVAPSRTEDKIDSCIVLATDITSRHEAEVELIRARDLAEAGNRAKSEFLAIMSHELRTPLNGVIGFTHLLADTPLNDEQSEFVQTICGSGEALLTIINDILDVSKIESGKFELTESEFDLRQMVEETVNWMAPRAEEKGLELAIWHDPKAPSLLHSDPARFRQILLNLVGNAIKFTEKGHILVEVEIDPASQSGGIRVNVRDTGIGIPREKHGLLFQKFTQVDGSSTRRFGGTGLGLAICKELIEMMGGSIGLESAPGHGSNFWFTHPATAADHPVEENAALTQLKGLRVLVVDDLEINRSVLHQLLESWGVEHETASSGPLALEILRHGAVGRQPYQIVLVDQSMPHMDGVAFAERVRADQKIAETKLILMISGSNRAEARKLLGEGFSETLCKPVARPNQLYGAIVSVWSSIRPVTQAAVEVAAEPPENTPAATTSRYRVLLAEDNPVNQRVATLHLRKMGCAVDCAATGREAVELFQRVAYDCIFMDVLMPDMDGFEATKRIRELQALANRIPIFALTANAMAGDRERCLAAGMDDYIAKPLQVAELKRVLETWLPRTEEHSVIMS